MNNERPILLASIRTLTPDEEKFIVVHLVQHTFGRLGDNYKIDNLHSVSSDFIVNHNDIVHIALHETRESPIFIRFTYILTKKQMIILSYQIWLNEILFAQQMEKKGTFEQEYDWVLLLVQLQIGTKLPGLEITTLKSYKFRNKVVPNWNKDYPLFNHQWESLTWMEHIEESIKTGVAHYPLDTTLFPIGKNYVFVRDTKEFRKQVEQKELVESCSSRIFYRGGILADSTGSGKTATILALILRNPCLEVQKTPLFPSRATLIITPVNLPRQWVCEINKFCAEAKLKVVEILDQRNAKHISLQTLCDADIVITTRMHLKHAQYIRTCNQKWVTHSGVSSIPDMFAHSNAWMPVSIIHMATRAAKCQGLGKQWESYVPLNSIHWHRIVIDEVHEEHPSSIFLHGLIATTWFGLTGTPEPIDSDIYTTLLVPSHPNLYPTQAFVDRCIQRHEILGSVCRVENHVLKYNLEEGHAMDVNNLEEQDVEAQVIMNAMWKPLEVDILVKLMPLEHVIIDVDKKYTKRSQELLRRQHQCREDLEECTRLAEIAMKLVSQYEYFSHVCHHVSLNQCPICYERNATCLAICGHMYCRECIQRNFFFGSGQCSFCKERLTRDDVYELESADTWLQYQQYIFTQFGPKMQGFLSVLRNIVIMKQEKAIVFVQYTSLLRNIQKLIDVTYPAIQTETLLGNTLSRAAVVDRFMQDQNVDVLFLPMELSNSGLNLTAANHILYVHPMMNAPTSTCLRVYEQCNARVVRPTQTKNVSIYYFIIQNTAEEEALRQIISYE